MTSTGTSDEGYSSLSAQSNSFDQTNFPGDDLVREYLLSKHEQDREASILLTTKSARQKLKGSSIRDIGSNKKLSSNSMMQSSDRKPSLITDFILIGSRDDATDSALLRKYGVSHVLNVAAQLPLYHENMFISLKVGLLG